MRSQSFRIRVSESMISLPILVVLASVIWMIPDIQSVALWGGLAAVGMMTYVMIAWNTQYQLIRVRSRMISISFLYVFLAFPQLHALGFHLFPAACLLGAYFLLFRTYGVYAPQGYFYHAFFLLGVGSLAFPPLLLLVPFLFFSSERHLRALTGKSAMAALLGLSLPYWLFLPVFLFAREWLAPYLAMWNISQLTALPDFRHVPLSQWVGSGLFFFISAASLVHFLRTSYDDKIRTRQYYYASAATGVDSFRSSAAFQHHFALMFGHTNTFHRSLLRACQRTRHECVVHPLGASLPPTWRSQLL